MRGAPALRNKFYDALGIIPADAGSTVSLDCEFCVFVDHPRGCGEHLIVTSCCVVTIGSSPRMRGARFEQVAKTVAPRIIPADAGSTVLEVSGEFLAADHPRGCGEHLVYHLLPSDLLGSSPRMRGALALVRLADASAGIIPADAGSTSDSAVQMCLPEDHPRGCGEHQKTQTKDVGCGGSSPRMRGALRLGAPDE